MSARGFDPDIASSASDAQNAAADPRVHVFVEANAGSGKTRVLVDRVARLLLQKTAPEDILCVTFTKAAAGEMQTRLFRKLGDWSVMADEALGDELRKLGGEAAGADLADARRLFARALETPGGLKIQTLHAYCESLLRRFPLEAGLPPGFATQEDAQAATLSAQAVASVYARAGADPDGDLGRAVVTVLDACGPTGLERITKFATTERHAFTEALDRAGGTDALKARAAERLDVPPGTDPEAIRAEALEGADLIALAACCRALLAGSKTDIEGGESLRLALDAGHAGDPEGFLTGYCGYLLTGKGEWRKSLYTKPTGQKCAELVALFAPEDGSERARMTVILARAEAAAALALTEAGITLAAALITAYEAGLARLRAADFADLVVRSKRLLTDSKAKDWTLYKLDRGLEHVLVDEAQDTAPDQWAVIGALTEEFFAGQDGSNRTRTLFCVGDEKQSIYSFQKADPALFVAQGAELEVKSAGAGLGFARPSLDVSFRSSPEVLAAVDLAFAAERAALEIKAEPGAPETKFAASPARPFHAYAGHRAARRGTPGCVEIWPAVPRPATEDETSIDLPLDHRQPNSARNQLAQGVAQEIADILARGDRVWKEAKPDWIARPAEPGDIIVLVRSRGGGLFDEIIRQLKIRNVPVAGADRMTLSVQLAVQDLISLARWALLPEDDLSLAEVLKSPVFHPAGRDGAIIDDDALFDLTRRPERRLWDKLRATDDARFTEAREALERARARVDRDAPYAFFASFLGEASSTGETRLARLYARLGEEARDPAEEFLSRALAHEREGAPSLARFIAAMAADASEIKREMEAGRGEVRVMTVHAAKGLEAPIVFLPDTTAKPKSRFEGLAADPECGLLWAAETKTALPALAVIREAKNAADEAESARLLYVALTRARDRLIVCGAKHGQKEGRVDPGSWHARLDAAWSGEGWTEVPTAIDGIAAANNWEGAARRSGENPPRVEREGAAAALPASPPVWAVSPAPEEPRAPRAVAPSRLIEEEEGGFEPASLSPLDASMENRFLRGALIHKLLQTLPDLEPARRRASAERFLAARRELSEAQRAAILTETLAVLDHPEFAPIFGPGSRAEVAVAGRAPGLPEGVSVNGQIDRLAVSAEEVLIVDFKTNRPPPKTAEAVPLVYLGQMAAYRALLSALHPGRPVRCALLWTDGPRLMELPGEMLDAALAKASGRRTA
ncbi:double-strand break repair helicase AddA [Glycocaulis profundi]|nr:double-strand break repair helicase AddA [Glycocaulis profundi]